MSRMVMLPTRTGYDPTNVIRHLAQYLGLTEEGVKGLVYGRDPRKPLADLWMEQNPRTKEDFHSFYSAEMGYYLWDLAAFNTQPSYWAEKAAPALEMLEIHRTGIGIMVDFGGGIGSLAIVLAKTGMEVVFVELPSPQRRFAEWRFKLLCLPVSVVSSLQEVEEADNVVAIDVMEHIHPDELPRVCHEFARILPQGGVVYATDEFGVNPEWPMHQETRQIFEDSMTREGFYQKEAQTWMKT